MYGVCASIVNLAGNWEQKQENRKLARMCFGTGFPSLHTPDPSKSKKASGSIVFYRPEFHPAQILDL